MVRLVWAIFGIFIFTSSSFAAGYTCPSYKKYTSCASGYYMTYGGSYNATPVVGNACTAASPGCTAAGGLANQVCCSTSKACNTWSSEYNQGNYNECTGDVSSCYKSCSVGCSQTTCVTDACQYGTDTRTGTQNYGGACNASQAGCPVTNYYVRPGTWWNGKHHQCCDGDAYYCPGGWAGATYPETGWGRYEVGVGYYATGYDSGGCGYAAGRSGIEACTNKPANSYYTSRGNGQNDCAWACNEGSTWNGSICACNTGYHWDGSQCTRGNCLGYSSSWDACPGGGKVCTGPDGNSWINSGTSSLEYGGWCFCNPALGLVVTADNMRCACPDGTYWDGSTCKTCEAGYYCNNNNRYSCAENTSDFGWKTLSYSSGGSTVTHSVYLNTGDVSNGAITGAAVKTQCQYEFNTYGNTDDPSTDYMHLYMIWNGASYVVRQAALYGNCRAGYYLTGFAGQGYDYWYSGCTACTNKPANSHYTGQGSNPDSGIAGQNDCTWACDDGYQLINGYCVPTSVHCPPGQFVGYWWNYNPSCLDCYTGSYCPGGDYGYDNGADTGIYNCPAVPQNYYTGTNTVATSDAGAKSATSCYVRAAYRWENHGAWGHISGFNNDGPCYWDGSDYKTCEKKYFECEQGHSLSSIKADGFENSCQACSVDSYTTATNSGFPTIGGTDTPAYSAATSCIDCPTGTYSGVASSECSSCTNKPANSYYTGTGGGENNCPWACDSGYHADGGTCVSNTVTCGECEYYNGSSCVRNGIPSGQYAAGGSFQWNGGVQGLTECPAGWIGSGSTPGTSRGQCYAWDCYKTCPTQSVPNGKLVATAEYLYWNGKWNDSGTYGECSYTTVCDNGYYLDGGSCVECGNQYYCNNNQRYSCWDVNPHPNLAAVRSVVDGNWAATTAWDASQCICDWHFSDEIRTFYLMETACVNGPIGHTYTHYDYCRTGYYATEPLNWNNWYNNCAACTNKPANSHYTGYSTPSTMYAVESNCPWECDSGYNLTNMNTCAQMCTTGISNLHSNGITVPLYAQKNTAPALSIQTSGGICYANLESGNASGAINVSYSGKTYHTVK